ncbi:LysR family transcriptional regulator [Cohnella candidum]|uniref:LysR family transcriptional regulator n=1 Tax=Cohnella candidum TaxID=2674991 RepID=A0A3G3JUN3_9BACL|nr:LysR family transcriptional regulator [Cohnella candidum]AYQ71567.1 LysR family transcriptional regulator [Cohnella candidum]
MDLDLRQLRYFIKVAEHLSFTEAANQLFVAQSAISQQIADLEDKIGTKLFVRSKRSVQLTPAGAVFLKEAEQIVTKSAEAVVKARQAESGTIGSLAVGFLAPHVRTFLPELIRRFRAKYPKIELSLNHFPIRMLKEALENGDLDVGFTAPAGLSRIDGIRTKIIRRAPYRVVLPCDHPLANRAALNLSELADEPFIIYNRQDNHVGSFHYIVQLCEKSGFTPKIASQPRFVDTVMILVEAGLGIAILPKDFEMSASSSLRFVEIEDSEDGSFELAVAWKKGNLNPSIPLFLEELEAIQPELPAAADH